MRARVRVRLCAHAYLPVGMLVCVQKNENKSDVGVFTVQKAHRGALPQYFTTFYECPAIDPVLMVTCFLLSLMQIVVLTGTVADLIFFSLALLGSLMQILLQVITLHRTLRFEQHPRCFSTFVILCVYLFASK